MSEQVINKVIEQLDKVAEKLGVGVQQIWPWLVKQQYIEAFWWTFLFALFSTVTFFTIKFTLQHWEPEPKEGKYIYSIYQEDHEVLWITLCVITAISSLISFVGLLVEFPDIFNPEYHALNDLFSLIK